LITVEEFLKSPKPKEGHLELHHGEFVLVRPPNWGHQRIQRRILALIMQLAEAGVVQMEMVFRPTPEHEVWQAASVTYLQNAAPPLAARSTWQGRPSW